MQGERDKEVGQINRPQPNCGYASILSLGNDYKQGFIIINLPFSDLTMAMNMHF